MLRASTRQAGRWPALVALILGVVAPALATAGEADENRPDLRIAPASDEPARAIAGFRVPEGFAIRPWAAEPLLANPVAFCVDDRGRVYVAETFRLHDGVTDNRSHMDWLTEDLAATTVADRVAIYRKYFDAETFAHYGLFPDRIRLVEDRDGDGTAETATVYAGGFDDVADGIGSGVIARDGVVWYTCIPHLWRLEDRDGDGVADVKESLSEGYGVHTSFLGHDSHGLIFGPDGKLYFTIGDRGLNVETKEGGRLFVADTGSVLRCNPDGTGLEVVATGLRNPQELAFDRHGDLFTVDNNSDGGDRARLVNVVEGGDSGWRIGYQYLEAPVSRGPWNAEILWKPESEGNDAAYLIPPIANVSDGPSGLAYNPGGASMPDRYADHFFLADFRGTPGNSGVRSFAVEPRGAGFAIVDEHQFLWSILATDVGFTPDGRLLVSDWVEGWGKPGKGRLYELTPDASVDDPTAAEVARLLAEGFDDRSTDALIGLLGHDDQRVRQRAQFALADRGDEVVPALTDAANAGDELTRLHAIWALGQLSTGAESGVPLIIETKLNDPSPHVRGQAAKLLGTLLKGESGVVAAGQRFQAAGRLAQLLDDEAPRVRMESAIALGKIGDARAVDAIASMLRANADRDPYLRHAGVMGLLGAATADDLDRLAGDQSPSVRLATLLVYRRQGNPEVARFLGDSEPRLILEAARAINDEAIDGATAKLAALDVNGEMPEPALRRVLNANLRVGTPEAAEAVATIASRGDLPEPIRVEALDLLADWAEPNDLDGVVGLYRPIEARSPVPAADALTKIAADLLGDAPEPVRLAVARATGALMLQNAGAPLFGLFADAERTAEARVEAIRALEALEDSRLAEVARLATDDREEAVRTEGLRVLSSLEPEQALPILNAVLQRGTTAERQGALATLGGMKSEQADRLISDWLDRLLADDVPGEIRLDLIEAAATRSAANLREKLARYEAARPAGDPLAPYRECLTGGNARRGFQVFFQRTEAQCLRCHMIGGQGGQVGPDLSEIGAKKERPYILEAIVAPNAQIAEGFETLVIATVDGQVLTGIVQEDTGEALKMIDAEGKTFEVAKADIEESQRGISAMPADLLEKLSKRDVRDLVEFLANRTTPQLFPRRGGHGQ